MNDEQAAREYAKAFQSSQMPRHDAFLAGCAHKDAQVRELLEAAERSLNWLSSYPGGNAERVYEQMRAALAKYQVKP